MVTVSSAGIRARPRFVVIHNPTAGRRRRRRLDQVLTALRGAGAEIAVHRTRAVGDAGRLAAELALDDAAALLVAGGDGTVNEVIGGLAGRAGTPPLGLVPLGTANVLAAELGLPLDADDLARLFLAGTCRTIHLGRAGGRPFAMMAGVGLDAHVVRDLDPGLKRLLGKAAYAVSAFRHILAGGRPSYQVMVDGVGYRAGGVILANGRFYGGRFVCAAAASLDRPELQVCLFPAGGRLNEFLCSAAVVLGQLHRLPGYRVVPGFRVRIDGPAGDPVQGDGDPIAHLPVEAGPDGTLTVLAPATGAIAAADQAPARASAASSAG